MEPATARAKSPAREDLSPELLRPHLGWVHLLDVLDDPRDFRFRLYGSHIAQMLNHDVTGLLLSQAFAGDFLAGLHGAFDRCATSRQPWLLETTGAGAGKDHMDIHSLLLPLSPDDDKVTMIMVRHVFDE